MLKQRVVTALIAVAILLSVLFLAPVTLARAVIGILFLAGAWEWSQFLGTTSRLVRLVFLAVVGAAQIALGLEWVAPDNHFAIFMAAGAWWLAALAWIFVFPTPVPALLAWIAGLLVLVPAYLAMDTLYQLSPWLLLMALVLIWLADIGAYFSGRAFGRIKLAPRVSPGKTWEGVFGGLVVVAIVAAVFASMLDLAPAVLIPFSMAAAALSVVGDLTVSMFKRTAGVKDSGSLFPGHGGILDRIDSVSAAAPLFAIGLMLAGVVG